MKNIFFIGLFLMVLQSKTQTTIDTLVFKNNWIDLAEQPFIKENVIPSKSIVKYNMLKKAILDTDSTLFEAAVLYRFLEMTPEEIEQDPFHEILIIDINKDGNQDVVFYLSPEIDAYLSVFWVFINDGTKFYEFVMTSGRITHIQFDEKGYKGHFTFTGKCCTYPYEVRSMMNRNGDSINYIVYQTLSSNYPKHFNTFFTYVLKENVEQFNSPEDLKIEQAGREEFMAGTEIEVLAEQENAWFVRCPANRNKTEFYLVWIPLQK